MHTLEKYELAPDAENLTQDQREEKVYNLTVELAEATLNKKSWVHAANDNLKRIKAELKDLVKGDLKVEQIN